MGQIALVKDYARKHKLATREMFVPLVHPRGYSQANFGEARVIIWEGEQFDRAAPLAVDKSFGLALPFPCNACERVLSARPSAGAAFKSRAVSVSR